MTDLLPIPPGGEAYRECATCGRVVSARHRVCELCHGPTGFEQFLPSARKAAGRPGRRERRAATKQRRASAHPGPAPAERDRRRDRRPVAPSAGRRRPARLGGWVALIAVLGVAGVYGATSGLDAGPSPSDAVVAAIAADPDLDDDARACLEGRIGLDPRVLALDGVMAADDAAALASPATPRPAGPAGLAHDAVRAVTAACTGTGGGGPMAPDAATFGAHPVLDGLTTRCRGDDLVACEALYLVSASGSRYESFGASCGGRDATDDGTCHAALDRPTDVDAFRRGCDRGDGASCDALYRYSANDSDDEHWGATCGGRFPVEATEDTWCTALIGIGSGD